VITRKAVASTAYGKSLLKFFGLLTPYLVTDWGNDDSDDKANNRPGDREEVSNIDDANVITSLIDEGDPWDAILGEPRHQVVLDIDHPAWLVKSTTPDHYHLYIDVPGGISNENYNALLDALANARVIEAGYAGASKARGFTSCRLPWVAKDKTGAKEHD